MLTSDCLLPLADPERQWFLDVVHFLRRLRDAIDFEEFRPFLEKAYKGFGRPPLDSVFLLKVELLARQYRLSDREAIAAVRFNIAYRLFLGISLKSPLPHHTLHRGGLMGCPAQCRGYQIPTFSLRVCTRDHRAGVRAE